MNHIYTFECVIKGTVWIHVRAENVDEAMDMMNKLEGVREYEYGPDKLEPTLEPVGGEELKVHPDNYEIDIRDGWIERTNTLQRPDYEDVNTGGMKP